MPIGEHRNIFKALFKDIDKNQKYRILDAGSGRTSLTLIISIFPNCMVDAIVYPGDLRKINAINENVPDKKFNLIESDICKNKIEKDYDIVVAHLLLGEAVKFDNSFDELLNRILDIQSKYLLIVDYPDDPKVDFEIILSEASKRNYKISQKITIEKEASQAFTDFVGSYYTGILFETSTAL